MMHILKKKQIAPIIIPTVHYKDRFGCPNSFVETNPSIFIEESGKFAILVRTVNYLKYKNKSFQIYGDSSRSLYTIIRGQLDDEPITLDNCHVQQMDVNYNIPRQPSLWYGVEDIRFIDETTILACIPECNNSSPCLFKGKITDNVLSWFEKCEPSQQEKNWMPYKSATEDKIIYSVSPFIIKSIIRDDRQTIQLTAPQNADLDGWHGSSNGIDIFGAKLFLIHKNEDRVINRWLLFNPITHDISYSIPFVFFKDSYIEFSCSLAKYKDRVITSVGVNDNRAFIIEVDPEEIAKLFSASN
jgi:hypothetical protein